MDDKLIRENQLVLERLENTLLHLQQAKPVERSERARRYAVTITEMEKVVAYFKTFVTDREG